MSRNRVVCRNKEIYSLIELLGNREEPLPHCLFINGSMSTGKSTCLTIVLKDINYRHVTINCIECYSPKTMYESILSGLRQDDTECKCETMSDLINGLNEFGKTITSYEPVLIIFKRAEKFRAMDQSIMCTFLRLREICNLNICTIFITHLAYDNFNFKMGVREPIKLFFPNYNKEELFNIIKQNGDAFLHHIYDNTPAESPSKDLLNPQLFENFLNAFLSVFYRPCRDLVELQYMARINFLKYCEPIITNEINATDLPKLWRHIAPILKTSLEHLYLRINAHKINTQLTEKDSAIDTETRPYNFENTLKEELMSTKTFAQSFELPYYAKFLLIAAYLASYNPPKEDKRLFMKNHGKQKKRLQHIKAKAKINEKLNTQLGPKVFTLDRLLAIFYAILEEKIGLTSNLLAQIATLVELKLIAGSKELDLDVSKYKCIVGYDFISAVAQTVGFNVRKYLYDFM